MGCESSNTCKENNQNKISISIIDSYFMKDCNERVRKDFNSNKIYCDCYISLSMFLEEFGKRYYHEVVTSPDHYEKLSEEMHKLRFKPNIYIVSKDTHQKSLPKNVLVVRNYEQLINKLLWKRKTRNIRTSSQQKNKENQHNKIDVKILWGPTSNKSQQQILNSILEKQQTEFCCYKNFNELEQSLESTTSSFIIVDYLFHQQILELVEKQPTKVICYCSFQEEEKLQPGLFFMSNNTVEIANQIRKQLKCPQKHTIPCTKVYLYEYGLAYASQIEELISKFQLDVRMFTDPIEVIKATTYFFCITVVAAQKQIPQLKKEFYENEYNDRVKYISISSTIQANIKSFHKIIKSIKSGYKIQKGLTRTVDIIDKNFNNTKFQQIKLELETMEINYYGYENLTEYIKNKKFVSPYIICNFEEKVLLVRYLKQLRVKSKIIIFCNKKKITNQLLSKPCYSYINSHFGKILKFIKKNHVYVPVLKDEQEIKLEENFQKIHSKNKRISAIKWIGLSVDNSEDPQTFQFLNIQEKATHAVIKDIQKSNSQLWKYDKNILENFNYFRKNLVQSLKQLRKDLKINSPSQMFMQLMKNLSYTQLPQLLLKTKDYFNSNHQFGVAINESLISLQKINRKSISYIREFFLLTSLNFISIYKMPFIGKTKLKCWVAHPLIEKCRVGSYMLPKNFLIMYQDSLKNDVEKLSKYKIQLEICYDTLKQEQLEFKPFFNCGNKYIFCPFTQFQLQKIQVDGLQKVLTLKYLGNSQFLKNIVKDNFIPKGKNLLTLFQEALERPNEELVFTEKDYEQIKNNLRRIQSLKLFKAGKVDEAISIHEKLIDNEDNYRCNTNNDLKYELTYFLNERKDNRMISVAKELMASNPSSFIQDSCRTIFKKFVNQGLQQNQAQSKVEESKGQNKIKTEKTIVGEDVYETFLWLKDDSDDEFLEKETTKEKYDEDFEMEADCVNIASLDDVDT